MGRVFLAVEETADFSRQLALKIIDRPLADGQALRRFRDELRILSLLEHPGIARFLHGGRSPEGIWYLALEYVDGVDLLTWAAEHELDRDARVRLFLAVLEPVRYAHERGVVHRDLKPRHLLIDRHGRPRLLDFGISKLLVPEGDGDLAVTRTGCASAHPRLRRSRAVPRRAGLTGDRCLRPRHRPLRIARRPAAVRAIDTLRGRLRTGGARVRAGAAPGLGRDLDAICRKALEKRPENRYRDAGELASDLERCVSGRAVEARRGSARRAVARLVRGRGALAAAGVALTVLAVAAIVAIIALSDGRGGPLAAPTPAAPPASAFPYANLEVSDIPELERRFAAAPESLPAGAILALALDKRRRLPEAKLIASRLRQIPGSEGDPLLDYVDATLATSSDEPQRALVLFTRARDGAIARGRGELVGQIRAARGRLLSTLGERVEAYQEMDLARRDFEQASDFESLARVLNDLAIEHLIGGELAQGQALLESSIAAARRAGTSPVLMLSNLGVVATIRGDPAKADSLLREAVAERRREGNPFRIGEVLALHGEALDDLGRRPEAIALLDEATAILRQADDKSALVAALYLRGAIAVSSGELEQVGGISAELELCGTQTGGYLGLISSYALRGLWADARGDGTAMRREFGAAEQLSISKGQLDFAAVTEAAHAAALLRSGDTDTAQEIALRALGRLPKGSATSAPMALAQSILARIDASSGRLDAARERLALFGDDATRSSSVSRRIALLAALATLERASGRPEIARGLFDQAIELAQGAGRRLEERDLARSRDL